MADLTPERRVRLKTLLDAAAGLNPAERETLLAESCGSDSDLRREVESLLAERDAASSRFDGVTATAVARPSQSHVLRTGQEMDDYRVVALLGAGGMGEVYSADDVRHNRRVAIKVLRPELGGALGLQRFRREIEIVAGLRHPHLLPLYDSGEIDIDRHEGSTARLLYFVMPLVEGESLRARLEREGQLPVEDALRIARESADALAFAHERGVLHRDVKPENILIERGHAVVADFGIAYIASGSGGERLTATGISLGTPAYMSPEQASGERVDARSDVYALGCVLYEMLAGEPPFTAATVQGVIAKRFAGPAPDVGVLRAGLPSTVRDAIARALARSPADRFSDAGGFARALESPHPAPPLPASAPSDTSGDARSTRAGSVRRRRIALGLVTVVALATAGGAAAWWSTRGDDAVAESAAARVATEGVTLAVLPFENLGRPEDAYLADGIADEIRGKLAALRGLHVIARSSSNAYRSTKKSAAEVARELGVQYLLTATIRWEPRSSVSRGRVRVTPELMHIAAGAPVTEWQAPFDATLDDVFHVQTDVATRVAEALDVRLGASDQARLAAQPTSSLAAYDAFLRAEAEADQLMRDDDAAQERAMRLYERAVALDSGFAMAWARLGSVRSVLIHSARVGAHPMPPGVSPASARTAAERAIALAPLRPEGYLAMGEYFRSVERSPSKTAEQIANGLRVAPNNPDLVTAVGVLRYEAGEPDSALAPLQRALALDPRSIFAAFWLGDVLLTTKRYSQAAEVFARARTLAPLNLTVLQQSVLAELGRGDLSAARAILRQAPRELGDAKIAAYFAENNDLGWVLDEAGQRLLLSLGPEVFDKRLDWGLALAQAHALRGDTALMHAFADSARIAIERRLVATSNDAELHALHGLALAYLGRFAEAEREGTLALAVNGTGARASRIEPYLRHQLVRIKLLAGERDQALDLLEPLLKQPYWLSPGWLRVDPSFAPLRGHPRFERLVREG